MYRLRAVTKEMNLLVEIEGKNGVRLVSLERGDPLRSLQYGRSVFPGGKIFMRFVTLLHRNSPS